MLLHRLTKHENHPQIYNYNPYFFFFVWLEMEISIPWKYLSKSQPL